MLSKKAKYAIKALVKLAKEYKKGPILISEISEQERIPKKFLEAILLELKNAGILNSRKGKGGGYYLLKSPDEVILSNVIRLFDGPLALQPCVSLNYYEKCDECISEEICGIRSVIKEVHAGMLNVLDSNSLQDIIEREEGLRKKK
ncbi:MAG: Rrf2 family transcriptional regulator [Cytophagaceae bacterium]|nr:Rrf2 family transcriptional regulator [Cytophagaceae bacterium]